MAAIALLIIDRFPQYLRYFAETEFRFDGRVLSPRNRLIKAYDGPLGMKTGHLPASGYHLVALAHLGQRRLLSVVMGATIGMHEIGEHGGCSISASTCAGRKSLFPNHSPVKTAALRECRNCDQA